MVTGVTETITVSMPYYRTPGTIARAVESVLAQTHRDLLLVVVNDGDDQTPPWPELAHITDPRLIRFDMPANHGRYFADAVVLAACSTPWFALCDADDWAEPGWLADMLAEATRRRLDAVYTPQWVHHGPDDPGRVEPVGDLNRLRPNMHQIAHHAALYRAEALRAVGGPHPGFRVGFDTLLTSLMALTGRVKGLREPLYHRVSRPGSLTTSPDTGFGSPHRVEAAQRLQDLYAACRRENSARPAIADVPAELRDQVAADAARLRLQMGAAVPPAPWGGWAVDEAAAQELAGFLEARRPRVIVEAGSGSSTVILAEYAARTGATVVSLEHQETFRARTAALLASRGLDAHVDLRLAPLADVDTPDGPHPWYRTNLPDKIDFVFLDGPPGTIGRHAAMHALHPHLADGWEVWLDDAHRPGEQDCLTLWRKHLGVSTHLVDLPKGAARIRAHDAPPALVDAVDVAVTILTGGRPDLLARTVAQVQVCAPGLLESAHVTVLHNGADPETADLLDGYAWIDARAVREDRLPIGQAVSELFAALPDRPFLLHLEDDWAAATLVDGWLDAARTVLEDPRIGQVRLRHRSCPVRDRNLVTGLPIVWTPVAPTMLAGNGHFTLNPAVMRTSDVPKVWPAAGEEAAMRRFHATGMLAAQATPGVFRHLGEGRSLHARRVL